jgi:hypothetical protein
VCPNCHALDHFLAKDGGYGGWPDSWTKRQARLGTG